MFIGFALNWMEPYKTGFVAKGGHWQHDSGQMLFSFLNPARASRRTTRKRTKMYNDTTTSSTTPLQPGIAAGKPKTHDRKSW